MFCHQCGAQINDGAAFCPNCGAKLVPGQATAAAPANSTQKKSKKLPIIIGCCAGAAVLVIAAVLIVIFVRVARDKEDYDASDKKDRAVKSKERETTAFWETSEADEEEEDSAAEDAAAVPDEEAAVVDYYVFAEALWYLMANNILPDGSSAVDAEMIDGEWDRFAICDINQDGEDELLISIVSGSMAANAQYVYRADPYAGDLELMHIFTNYTTYYDTGVIMEAWSHNQGLSVSFWPYNVWQWDADGCMSVGGADAWEKEFWETDYSGNAFPDQVDVDGNGMVYFIGGAYEIDYDNPVDDAEYNAFVSNFFEDANAIDVQWLNITDENIESATGYAAAASAGSDAEAADASSEFSDPLDDYFKLSGLYEGYAGSLSISIYTSIEEGETTIGNAWLYIDNDEYFLGEIEVTPEQDIYLIETDEGEVLLDVKSDYGAYSDYDMIVIDFYVDGQFLAEFTMVEHYES